VTAIELIDLIEKYPTATVWFDNKKDSIPIDTVTIEITPDNDEKTITFSNICG